VTESVSEIQAFSSEAKLFFIIIIEKQEIGIDKTKLERAPRFISIPKKL
jgi:hypothetical protein